MTDQVQEAIQSATLVSDGRSRPEAGDDTNATKLPNFPIPQFLAENHSLEEFPYETSEEAKSMIHALREFKFPGLAPMDGFWVMAHTLAKVRVSYDVPMKFKASKSTYMIDAFRRSIDVLTAVHIPLPPYVVSKVEVCRKTYTEMEDVYKNPNHKHLRLEVIETLRPDESRGYPVVNFDNHSLNSVSHTYWAYCLIVHVDNVVDPVTMKGNAVIEGYMVDNALRTKLHEVNRRIVPRCEVSEHEWEKYAIMSGGQLEAMCRCKKCKLWETADMSKIGSLNPLSSIV